MGYYPPSPIDYSNGGWKYHQENTDSEHSNQWRYASEPQDEQDKFMGYYPTPQDDSYGGWEYHQELTDSEQPNQWEYASENDQDNFMRYCPPPQDDLEPQSDSYYYDTNTNYDWEGNFNAAYSNHSKTLSLDYAVDTYMEDCSPEPQNDQFYNDSHCGWEDQNQKVFDSSYSTYQEPSSLEQTFNSFMQNYPTSPHSSSFENSSSFEYISAQKSFHTSQNNFTSMSTYLETHSQPSSFELTFE
ncbi:hypothetical protein AHAS_Ahas16G0208800 [Arachis hypogaea]